MTQKVHGLRWSRTHLFSLSVSESQELSCGLAEWFWLRDCREIIVKTLALAAVTCNVAGAEGATSVLAHSRGCCWEPQVLRHEPPFSPPLAPWTHTQGLLESPHSMACGFPQSKHSKRTKQQLQCVSESCPKSHTPSFPQDLSGQPGQRCSVWGDHTGRQGPRAAILAAGYHRGQV